MLIRLIFIGVLSLSFVGCAKRVVTSPMNVPQFQKDFDRDKKQLYVRDGNIDDVVYTNYTDQELQSIRTGQPIRTYVDASEITKPESSQWSSVEHTFETDAGFVLLYDANENQEQRP